MPVYDIEVTDTFSGEANYCWVRRYTIDAPDDATPSVLIRRAKREAGLSKYRHKPHYHGRYADQIRIDFAHVCVCMFITYRDPQPAGRRVARLVLLAPVPPHI